MPAVDGVHQGDGLCRAERTEASVSAVRPRSSAAFPSWFAERVAVAYEGAIKGDGFAEA